MTKRKKARVYSEVFKLRVLTDYYSHGGTLSSLGRKWNVDPIRICQWTKRWPVDSKSLSLSSDIISSYRMEHPDTKLSHDEILQKRICDLEHALARKNSQGQLTSTTGEGRTWALAWRNPWRSTRENSLEIIYGRKSNLPLQKSKRYIIFGVPETRRALVLSISLMSMTSYLVQSESMCQVIQYVWFYYDK